MMTLSRQPPPNLSRPCGAVFSADSIFTGPAISSSSFPHVLLEVPINHLPLYRFFMTAPTPSRSEEFLTGIREEAPLLIGIFPFGMVFGVLGLEAGMDPLAVFFMSSIVFGGASQVIFAQMVSAGTSGIIIAGTVGIVNLRHALYSASMVQYLGHLNRGWRILLSYLLTDEAFFISLNRLETRPHGPYQHYHLLGTGLTLWTCWQVATGTGILIGAALPPSLGLGFAIPLTFMALLAPMIRHKPSVVALITAGSLSLLTQNLPWNTSVIIAALAGMIAGALTEDILRKKDGRG